MDHYILYTDKPETFSCDIAVKNANLKNSMARLVIESADLNLIFNGKIENGKCNVPIKKLKGLLDESVRGKISLEVIVEDTYFVPWTSNFIVEERTSVKVQVNEQKNNNSNNNKPIVEVKSVKKQLDNKSKLSLPAQQLLYLCERFDIGTKNYTNKRRDDFKQIVKEYFKENKEYKKKMNSILNEVISGLNV